MSKAPSPKKKNHKVIFVSPYVIYKVSYTCEYKQVFHKSRTNTDEWDRFQTPSDLLVYIPVNDNEGCLTKMSVKLKRAVKIFLDESSSVEKNDFVHDSFRNIEITNIEKELHRTEIIILDKD